MPKSRFHWHIIKCPDKKRVGEHYAACPFNAQHIILKSEMTNHKMKCPDRDQREMISGQSDDIDRRIKEYLANQNHNKQNVQNTGEWGSSSWDAASNLPVGETLDITPSTKPKKKEPQPSLSDNNNLTSQTNPVSSTQTNGVKVSKDSSKSTHVESKPVEQIEQQEDPSKILQRQIKSVKKKLSQIQEIEHKQQQGQALNADQLEKLKRKQELEQELKQLNEKQEK